MPLLPRDAELLQHRGVLREHVLEEHADGVAEQDRVGDLHHRRLEMQRQQRVARLRGVDLGLVEVAQRIALHEGGRDDLVVLHLHAVLEHGDLAGLVRQLDAHRAGLRDHGRLFVTVEVARRSCSATRVFESALHLPIECGCLRAYCFTAFATRRSELPSRSTGFTALPSTFA